MDTVTMLINSEKTNYTEEDRDWLSALSDEQLQKMTPKEAPTANAEKPCDCAQKIDAILSNEDRDALAYGKQALAQRRSELVAHITANGNGAYTAEELAGINLEALEKLGKAIKAPAADFSIRSAPIGNLGNLPVDKVEPLKRPTINWTSKEKEIVM